ncbi:hypothetical protein AB4853_10450 [Bradyrhizobium sp. 1050_B9_N1_2]|uniref:hypothetical protein n=1 Tax=Bradyrhizobium sp. 1050_B9_N1_2 TaxID=3238688 RepID=UPI003EDBDC71
MPDNFLEIADPSNLTDADWAEINNLRRAHESGGAAALNQALEKLRERDAFRYFTVVGAFFPNELREAVKDEMANRGVTDEDLRVLVRKLESPARDQ